VEGKPFLVPDSAYEFVLMLAEYCELCTSLPSTSVELGLKTAELMKFFNSRICQLIIGAGAISVSGLKTITIRNLALAGRSVQLVMRLISYIRKHFEQCHHQKMTSSSNGIESTFNNAESKQLETFRKQFEQV
jgi:vacuolar protein sorting-associated protein 54